jgi:hypothetical protein
MKIIYVPVVVPVNLRTLLAQVLGVVSLLLLIVAVATESWLSIVASVPSPDPVSRVTRLQVSQGLQSSTARLCAWSSFVNASLCDATSVDYSQCGRRDEDEWCKGHDFLTYAYGSDIVALLLLVASIAGAFYREFVLGPLQLISCIGQAVALGMFFAGGSNAVAAAEANLNYNLVDSSKSSMHSSYNYGFYAAVGSLSLTAVGAFIGMSLFVHLEHGDENRAHNAPSIQVVRIDASNSTVVAPAAAAPGFVRLSDGRFSVVRERDEADDVELITEAPSPSHPVEYTTPLPIPPIRPVAASPPVVLSSDAVQLSGPEKNMDF